MKQFDVLCQKTGEYELVKRGVSWPGLFFMWIWAATKQMWGIVLLYFAIVVCSEWILDSMYDYDAPSWNHVLLFLIVACIFGAMGNSWWRSKLLRTGYSLTTTIEASNRADALIRYSEWRKKSEEGLRHNEATVKEDGEESLNLDALGKLNKLGELKNKGILTDEEFQREKKKILDGRYE